MTDLAEHDVTHLPDWIRFREPRDAHHAAFEAWLHAPSRCVLLKLWMPADADWLSTGHWQFAVRHPDGRWRTAWYAGGATVTDEALVLQSASSVVRDLVKVTDQAR